MTDAGGPHKTPEGSPGASRSTRALGGAVRDRAGALSPALAIGPVAVPGSATSFVRSFAAHDWLTLAYLVTLLCALALGRGPNRSACIIRVFADLGVYLFVLVMVRMQLLRWGSVGSSLVYRTAVIGTILASFFQLREILPAVSPYSVDARIYAFDLHVFGFEPSVVLDRFVSPVTTEWFSFFYFLYFLILSVHILPMVYWQRDPHLLARFALGVLLMFLTAHLVYMLVPGWGPYWYLKGTFQHELTGGTFLHLVRETVDAGGAQKDIFPSLHTAVPTFFAIFSFRHRKLFPFKYTWPVMAFVATQIIIATMFLRWHYLVDIVAGLTLATTAALLGQHIADWERTKRERLGIQPVWMPLVYPWTRAPSE